MTKFLETNQEQINKLKNFVNNTGNDESSLITILHQVQELFGYIPREMMELISSWLNIPLSKIYGVITFYSCFTTEKKGQNTISICMGTACFVKGANHLKKVLEEHLGISEGMTTADGKITLCEARCVGACGLAPVVTVNNEVHGQVTEELLLEIIADLKDAGEDHEN